MKSVTKRLVTYLLLSALWWQENIQASGYFWHITDFHYDPTYFTSQQSCNDVIPRDALGQFGDYECDSPFSLVEASVKAMKEAGDSPDFILWTGDNTHHPKNPNDLNETLVIEMQRNATEVIQRHFPNSSVVVSLGNHDYFPKDQLPGGPNRIYTEVTDMWTDWLGADDAVETFKKGAYYTTMLSKDAKVRAIMVNTNLYSVKDQETEGQTDPAAQFQWLEDTLALAKGNDEKVHLFIHIPTGVMPSPPGNPKWLRPEFNAKLNSIIEDSASIILAITSCHEHLDTFRLYYQNDEPIAPLFITPSVSPWRARFGANFRAQAHNPSFRKFVLNNSTWEVIDIEQYYLDLPEANKNQRASWRKLYSFKELYGLNDLSADSLHGLVQDFKLADDGKFVKYAEMNPVKATHASNKPCDCACKSAHICTMENIDFDDFDKCMDEPVVCASSKLQLFGGHIFIVMLALILKL